MKQMLFHAICLASLVLGIGMIGLLLHGFWAQDTLTRYSWDPQRRSLSNTSILFSGILAVSQRSSPGKTAASPAEVDQWIELMRDSGEMRWHGSHEPGATVRRILLGFHYYQGGGQLPDGSPWSNFEFSMPWWPLIALSVILPGWWVVRCRRQRRMAGLGLCPNCGYDLRATSDRCPECGTLVARASSP
jgi:hypothetical protein